MTNKQPPLQLNEIDEKVLTYFIKAAKAGHTTPRTYDMARSFRTTDAIVQQSVKKLIKMKRLRFDRTLNCEIVGTGLITINRRVTYAAPEDEVIEVSRRPFAEAMAGRLYQDIETMDGFARFCPPETSIPRNDY